MSRDRLLCWFSCGATSMVATQLALKDERYQSLIRVVAYIDTGSEHYDNYRVLRECREWFGQPALILQNDKYINHFDVIYRRRYINGPRGAACTSVLKTAVRQRFENPMGDVQVFGFSAEEGARFERLQTNYPECVFVAPLIELGITEADCHAILMKKGIQQPVMYSLGYRNNNCIGCVKGGKGYWLKIKKDWPQVYHHMARLEHVIGRTCIKGTPLKELETCRQKYPPIVPSCSFFCSEALDKL